MTDTNPTHVGASTPVTDTERTLARIFVESTGTHFLDSGGDFGRLWQRTRKAVAAALGHPDAVSWTDAAAIDAAVIHYFRPRARAGAPIEGYVRTEESEPVAIPGAPGARRADAGAAGLYWSTDTWGFLAERLDVCPAETGRMELIADGDLDISGGAQAYTDALADPDTDVPAVRPNGDPAATVVADATRGRYVGQRIGEWLAEQSEYEDFPGFSECGVDPDDVAALRAGPDAGDGEAYLEAWTSVVDGFRWYVPDLETALGGDVVTPPGFQRSAPAGIVTLETTEDGGDVLARGWHSGDDIEVGGFYGEDNPVTCNTYNHESALDRTLLWSGVGAARGCWGNDGGTVAVHVHGGADVRGGYADAVVFVSNGCHGDALESIADDSRSTVTATGDGPSGPVWHCHGSICEDSYDQETGDRRPDLDTFPVVVVESAEHVDAVLAHYGPGEVLPFVEGHGDDSGAFCPYTGRQLRAWS